MDENKLVTPTELTKTIPGRPHSSTVWRWMRNGVKVRGGQERVRLRHVRAGARLLTTKAWLEDFMTALANADRAHFERSASSLPPPPRAGERKQDDREKAAAAACARIQFVPRGRKLPKSKGRKDRM